MTSRVDFIIVTALEEERDAVLERLPGYQEVAPSKDDVRFYYYGKLPATFSDGSTCTYGIVVTQLLGMGHKEAANATNDAIRRWHPRYVILVGIAGGIAAQEVELGDVLIPDKVVDYELQKKTADGSEVHFNVHNADARLLGFAKNYQTDDCLSLISTRRPREGKPRRIIGPIATGNKVIASTDFLKIFADAWPKLVGVEMEAGGVANACFQSEKRPGFFMVRGVSDLADEQKNTSSVEEWRSYACEVAASFTIGLLKSGAVPSDNDVFNKGSFGNHSSKLLRQHQRGFLDSLTEYFVGRGDILEHVRFLLDQGKAAPVWLTGEAGMGKSAFVAKLVAEAPGCLYHFVLDGEDPKDLLTELCHQAAYQLGGQYEFAGRDLSNLKNHLGQLVGNLRPKDRDAPPILILIDGLDEGDRSLLNPQTYIWDGEGVAWLVSFRSSVRLRGQGQPLEEVHMDPLDAADVSEFFHLLKRQDLAAEESLVERIVKATHGEPFYLRFLLPELAKMEQAAIPAELPKGAEAYLHEQLRKLHKSLEDEVAYKVLAIIAQARGPIGLSTLQGVLGQQFSSKEQHDMQRRLDRWVIMYEAGIGAPETRYWVNPIRLRLAIRNAFKSENAEEKLVQYCRAWQEHSDPYVLDHAVEHFITAKDNTELQRLATVDFIRTKAAERGGLARAIPDALALIAAAVDQDNAIEAAYRAALCAWLAESINALASTGGIAFYAAAGHFEDALAAAQSIWDRRERLQQQLIVAEKMLDADPERSIGIIERNADDIEAEKYNLAWACADRLARKLITRGHTQSAKLFKLIREPSQVLWNESLTEALAIQAIDREPAWMERSKALVELDDNSQRLVKFTAELSKYDNNAATKWVVLKDHNDFAKWVHYAKYRSKDEVWELFLNQLSSRTFQLDPSNLSDLALNLLPFEPERAEELANDAINAIRDLPDWKNSRKYCIAFNCCVAVLVECNPDVGCRLAVEEAQDFDDPHQFGSFTVRLLAAARLLELGRETEAKRAIQVMVDGSYDGLSLELPRPLTAAGLRAFGKIWHILPWAWMVLESKDRTRLDAEDLPKALSEEVLRNPEFARRLIELEPQQALSLVERMPSSESQRDVLLELAGARRIDLDSVVLIAKKIEEAPERAVALAGIGALRQDRTLYQEALDVPVSNYDRGKRDWMGPMVEAANKLGQEALESLVDIVLNTMEGERGHAPQTLMTALSFAGIRLSERSLDRLRNLNLDSWTRGQLIFDQGVEEGAGDVSTQLTKSIAIGLAEPFLLSLAGNECRLPLPALEEALGDLRSEIDFVFDWCEWIGASSAEQGPTKLLNSLFNTTRVHLLMPILGTITAQAWGKSRKDVRDWRLKLNPWAAHIATCGIIEAYHEDRDEWLDYSIRKIKDIPLQARVPPPTEGNLHEEAKEGPSARVKACLRIAEALREDSPEDARRFFTLAYQSAINIQAGKGAYPDTELLAIALASERVAPDLSAIYASQSFEKLKVRTHSTIFFEERLLEVLTERLSKDFNKGIERSEVRIQAWQNVLRWSRKKRELGIVWTALCWLARFGSLRIKELDNMSQKLKDPCSYNGPKLWVLYRCTEAWLNISSKGESLFELIDLEEDSKNLSIDKQGALTTVLTNYPYLERDPSLFSDLVSRVYTKAAALAAVERCIDVNTLDVLCEHLTSLPSDDTTGEVFDRLLARTMQIDVDRLPRLQKLAVERPTTVLKWAAKWCFERSDPTQGLEVLERVRHIG